jgi:hypothetical protein
MKLRNALVFIIVLVLIFISIGVGALFFTEKESIYFAMSSAVLASIIASLIYGAFSFLLLKEPASEKDQLKSLMNEFHNRELNGIKHICHKFEQKPEYWNDIVRASTKNLDMMGHAFTTWTHDPHKDFFADKIIEIAKGGGKVRIVILSPDGENTSKLTDRFGRKYKERVNETLDFFKRDVLTKLSGSKRNNITIKLEGNNEISYMYINNGRRIVVSPYYVKASDSKDNLVIEFGCDSKFGGSYTSDFNQVFKGANEWEA